MIPPFFPFIVDFLDTYEGYLLDVWGTLHNGSSHYPHVLHHLRDLQKAQKKVLLFTNSPRSARTLEKDLYHFGITPDHYNGILSSGSVGEQWLLDNPHKCYLVGYDYHRDTFPPGTLVPTLEEAQMLAVCYYDKDFWHIIKKALDQGLPMLCLNPDLSAPAAHGGFHPCAGEFGKWYEEQSGKVYFIGKPFPLMYERAFEIFTLLGVTDRTKILGVGDGLHTDILGAQRNNLDTAYVLAGLPSRDLQIRFEEKPERDKLAAHLAPHPLPTYVVGGL